MQVPALRLMVRCAVAAIVAAIILAATETVAGYPRPSSPAGTFFGLAVLTYTPFLFAGAGVLYAALAERGLDLWLPLGLGAFRAAAGLASDGAASATAFGWLLVFVALLVLFARWLATSTGKSPPFLFGLTVGVVLPILVGRVAMASVADRLGGTEAALAAGSLGGTLAFLLLRSFVARFPRVALVFLLGPVVSLGLWSARSSQMRGPTPATTEATRAAAPAPDIVLIVLDTVRADSFSGGPGVEAGMPNLAAFAGHATTFRRAWTTASWTLPAHASLFCGRRLSGHRYDSGFGASERLPPQGFLAPQLRARGYATGAFVANFGVFGREEPLVAGFESLVTEPLRPIGFEPWLFGLLKASPHATWLAAPRSRFPGPSVRAPAIVDQSLEFWNRFSGRPRFLFVNLMEAHLPWIPDAADLGRYGPPGLDAEPEQLAALGKFLHGGAPSAEEATRLGARYREAVHSLDRTLARLFDGLRASGLRDPIIVVTSDHGESLGEHERFGHRNSLDEAATRIPLVIHGPGYDSGATVEAPVQLVDLYGFLAQAAGLPGIGATDALPLGARRYVVLEHRPEAQGFLPRSYPRGDLSALIEWPFKYSEGSNTLPALFDLANDPGEQRDLVLREPARAEALRLTLRGLAPSRSSGAPGPMSREAEERLRALGYVR